MAIAIAIAVLLTLADLRSPLAIVLAWFAAIAVVGGLIQIGGYIFPAAIAGLGLAAFLELLDSALPTRITPLLGGGLLACAELGYWSFELRANIRHSAKGILRRAAVILVLVVVGATISGLGVTLFEHISA